MVTVICQHTGVAFQAPTRRAKNHPEVIMLLSRVSMSGTYSTIIDRLHESRDAGLTELEEILTYARTGDLDYFLQCKRRSGP